jgi:hypothetical protein
MFIRNGVDLSKIKILEIKEKNITNDKELLKLFRSSSSNCFFIQEEIRLRNAPDSGLKDFIRNNKK